MSTGDHGKFYNSHTLGPTPPSQTGNSSRYDSSISIADSSSLSTNYLPTKFGGGLVSRKRQGKEASVTGVPKRGGGRDAFKPNEPRMPGTHDEDYDGVQGPWFGPNAKKPILRWTRFKWIMFVANIFLTVYSLVALAFCLLTWFLVWDRADAVRAGNKVELVVSTVAATLGIVTSLVGWAGILLNNRGFLAWYTFLLWICFAFLVTPGYVAYKKRTFNLEGKLNSQWSRGLGAAGRLAIQNQLGCCGSVLPGCKGSYMRFQRIILRRWFTIVFTVVPLHLFVMISALLCSNHVTYRFGKGMTPKAYRLDLGSMAILMDNYANQLAEQYGSDVASEMLVRSRSNLYLDAAPYERRY